MRLFTGFLFLLAISCAKPKPQYEITKVELTRSGAWSDFGGSISIDSSLNYKYYGDYGKVKQWFFTGKVSTQFWDTLNQKLKHIKYKTLSVTNNENTVDVNYYQLIIHWKNGERKISRMEKHPADSLFDVIYWIDSSYRKIQLRRAKDTIRFESKYHWRLPRFLDSVKFPPPISLTHRLLKNKKVRSENY